MCCTLCLECFKMHVITLRTHVVCCISSAIGLAYGKKCSEIEEKLAVSWCRIDYALLLLSFLSLIIARSIQVKNWRINKLEGNN